MIKGQQYNCVYVSGGGTEYPEGRWRIKTLTDKTMIIVKVSEAEIYSTYDRGDKLSCLLINSQNAGRPWKHPLRDWEDGTFTIYPNQAGIPYYFEPVKTLIDEYKNELKKYET